MPASDKISVIVPVYNGERHLAEALASILGQSRPAAEVLVVDDGSTDGSSQLLAGCRGITVLHQANRGVAAARNLGLRHASGSLIAFLDQDDRWHPDKLARQSAFLESRPDASGVFACEEIFLDEGAVKPGWLRRELLEQPHPSFVPGALLVRRAAFDRIGMFDESYRCGSDTDWICRARDAGLQLEMLDDTLLYKRVHSENESRRVEVCHKELATLLRQSLQRRRSG